MELSTKLFRRHSCRWGVVCFLMCFLFFNASVSTVTAGPEGAQVVNGQVTIQQSGNNTAITASDRAIINYSSFDIAQPETVQFIQPGSTASVLNRILSANPTNINGTLLANGRVFFVNPAGVYIGNGATINVNQLVASGLNISDADFINGRYNFTGGNGSVINNGDISAQQVYLIGKQVTNSGSINCPAGYVVMAAGDRVFLGEPGSDIVLDVEGTPLSDSADATVSEVGVLNEGTVEAAGGIIALAAAGDIYSQAISNVGSLSTSVDAGDAGQIKLASAGGEVVNAGTIEASGSEGGQVSMEGARVGQFGTIHTDGITGDGGNVDLTASDVVALSSDSITTANAGTNGNGGEVIVYSPDTALFRKEAKIEAKGGTESGDGGFVEVSGKKLIEVYGSVDASATNGMSGTFYIDPTDVTLSNITANMDNSPNWDPVAPDQDTGTIDVATIVSSLQNGTDVSVDTYDDDGGGGTGRIIVDSAINVDLSTVGGGSVETPTLTLNAQDDIDINAQIGVSATDAVGDLLNLDLNATNGVDIGANITDLSGGALTSDGTTFNNTGTITTNGGNITLTHTGAVTIGGTLSSGSGSVDIDAGGTLALNAGISTSTGDVTLDSTGTTTIAADGDITAGGAVTFGADKAGTLTTSGNIHTTDDDVTFTRAVTLGGNVDIDTTGTAAGNILFNSTIDTAGNNLALDAGPAGNVTLSDALTGGGDVTVRDGAVQSYQAMTLNSLDIQDATTSVTFNGDVAASTNIGIVSGGTVEVAAGNRIIAGGDGTALTINGNGITLNAGGAGTQTVTNTGTGTINITDSGTTSLANNSISIGSGTLTIDSANIAAPGNSTEIFTNGNVSLTGAQIGGTTGNEALDIDFAGTPSGNNTLTVNTDGDGDVGLDINSDLFNVVDITVANVTTDKINIDWATDSIDMETDTTALTINSIDTSDLNTNVSITQSVGDVLVSTVDTGSGSFTLESTTGSIDDASANPNTTIDITASSIDLNAATGIGATAHLELAGGTIEADTTNGAINLNSLATAGVTVTSLTTGTGSIQFNQTGGQTLDVDLATTTDGAITLTNDNAALTATSVTAGGSNNIQLTTTTDGNVLLGAVDAAGNQVTVTSAAAIEDDGTSDGTAEIAAATIDLNASTGIGAGGSFDVTGTSISADTTDGAIDLDSLATGGVTVTSLTTGTGSIHFDQTGGQTLNVGLATTTDGAITLTNDNAALTATSVTAGGSNNIQLTTTSGGNMEVDSLTAGNAISIESAGAITQSFGTITANGGSLTMRQRDSLDTEDFTFGNQASTDLTLQSTNGSVSSMTADDWQSITATAEDNIELQGTGNIKIGGDLTSDTGGVSIVSDNGTVFTAGDTILDNITIIGNPAAGGGVDLDPDKPSGGKAAIVIRTKEDLTLGSNAELIANGTYDPQQYDDRSTVGFEDSISGGGDPIDVAIYLRSHRVVSGDPSGHVAVGSKVTIAKNGTMIVDAGENVTFGGKLNESVFNQTNRLEVVSRRSQNLNEVIRYNRLPFADNPEAIRNWFNETSTGYFTGAYVLRGVKTLLAEVLALSNPVPLVPPRTLEPEIRGEVKGPDTEALAKLLSELGIGVQPYVTEAYADSLSTDLRLYKAAEKLQKLMPALEDVNGIHIAGLRETVAEYFPTLDVLSDERMDSFAQVLASHKGDQTNYDLAGQCISALTEYVNILSTEIGWPAEKSVEFVMGRYVPRLTENDEIRIAVIQMHLQKEL